MGSFRGGVFPEIAATELLNWFGAMDGIVATPLGQWARRRLDPEPSISDVQRPDPATTDVASLIIKQQLPATLLRELVGA